MQHLTSFCCILLLFGPLALVGQAINPDEQAVRTVIEQEARAYLNRNAPQQAACWASQTGLSQRISLENGRVVVANGDQASLQRGLASCFRQLTQPDSSVCSYQDYRIRIRGEAAFVTFRQVMQPKNQPASHSQQMRYLEREAAGWKIVHTGVMYYEPIPDAIQTTFSSPPR